MVFQSWDDVQDLLKRMADFTKTILPHSRDVSANRVPLAKMSENQAETIGQQFQAELKRLENEFRTEGKILVIPVGTQIEITKYCDKYGNEVEPVWNDAAKTFFTRSGDFVYVSGEWEGKSVITLLVTHTAK
jgi:hypothetical protein